MIIVMSFRSLISDSVPMWGCIYILKNWNKHFDTWNIQFDNYYYKIPENPDGSLPYEKYISY